MTRRLRAVTLPKVFEPFGRVGEPEARNLVKWLQAPGKLFERRVFARCVEVRSALEKMLDKQSSLWSWPEPKWRTAVKSCKRRSIHEA